MRTSTKIVAAVLVVAAGGAVAAPLVTGTMAEQRMHAFAEHRAFEDSPYLDWVVTQYEPGYLGATATSELTFRHPGIEPSYTVVLDHHIEHALAAGNALLRIHTTPRIPEGRPQQIATQLFGQRSPLTVDYRMRVEGTSIAEVYSPATDGMREIDGAAVDWKGLDGEVMASAGGDAVEYRLDAPGLHLEPRSGELESFSIGALRAAGDMKATGLEDIWVGDGESSIEFLRAEGNPEGDFAISGIELRQEASLQQGLLAVRLDARIATVTLPERELRGLRLRAGADRLSPHLVRASNALSRQTAAAESEAERQRVVRQILERVPWGEIAQAEPVISIELQGNAGQGPVAATGEVGLNAPGQDQLTRIRMMDLAGHGYAELSVRAPEPVVVDLFAQRARAGSPELPEREARRSARQQIEGLQAQGWIQLDGGELRASASYDRGMIRINGRSLFGLGMGS